MTIRRHPSWPYIAPFAVFLVFVTLDRHLPYGVALWYPLRVLAVFAVLLVFSRRLISLKASRVTGSVFLGLGVFVLWIVPDLLWPGYRNHWLLQNFLTGRALSSVQEHVRIDLTFIVFRVAGTAILVPIIEEIFWRAWLMRYLISRDFETVPLGAYSAPAFWITAVLFASEHGPYWEVGLMAGVAYNWWMVRTRNLANCILSHAVTNISLAAYVLAAGKWEYWL